MPIPKKILLVRIDRIGDMLCSTPAIRAFRQAYPDARIDLVASNKNVCVVRENPDVDNVYVFPLNKIWLWPWHFMKYRLRKYDMVVSLNGSSKTASRLVAFTNAPVKSGTRSSETKAYYDTTIPNRKNEHVIRHMLRLAAEMGAPCDDERIVFPVDEALLDQARQRFPARPGLRRVAIFIGNAKKNETRWPADKFVELTGRLLEREDVEVYIVAGPGDEPLLEGFSWTDRCLRYPGGSLQALGAFLKTCDMFVTSSSGPMHVGAAVEVPMVSVLAGFTYNCWRPLGPMHRAVSSDHPGVDARSVPVDEVLAAANGLLDDLAAAD